jgi:plastocyanin
MNNQSISGWGKALLASLAIMVVLVVALVAFAFSRSESNTPTTYSFNIEKGTSELIDAGITPANQPPTELNIKVGDTLEVVNDDDAVHSYSFITVRPGETGSYTFKTPGTYVGACTVGVHTSVTIVVT